MFGYVLFPRSLVLLAGLLFATGTRIAEETNASDAIELRVSRQSPATKVTMQLLQPKTNTEQPQAQPKVAHLDRLTLAELLGPPKTHLDIRHNIPGAAVAETRWAVRVLRNSGIDNSEFGLLWEQPWATGQLTVQTRAPMEILMRWLNILLVKGLKLDKALQNVPITDPSEITYAINGGAYGFKGGMDTYIINKLDLRSVAGKGPNCEVVELGRRDQDMRNHFLFKKRGRVELAETNKRMRRQNSIFNTHAGIAQYEETPMEALNFFKNGVVHGGKNFLERSGAIDQVDKLFWDLGAPFIGGASGSIEFMILSMEEADIAYPLGIVPCKTAALQTDDQKVYFRPLLREALIALMTAVLIAGGQHSLTECLAVAQVMGYFQDVPFVLRDYPTAGKAFQDYVGRLLGVKGASGALDNLQARVDAARA